MTGQSCPVKAISCKHRWQTPHPHKHNTFSRTYESDTESETEDYEPRHFTVGSLKIHEHYNATTDHEHLDMSSEVEHSPMDYKNTPMLTYTEHIATTPPPPQSRPSRTPPVPPPRPSKLTNRVTNCRETANGQHKISFSTPIPIANQENTIVTYTTHTSLTTYKMYTHFKITTMQQQQIPV